MFKHSSLAAAVLAVLACSATVGNAAESAARKTLTAFNNDQELAATLKRWREQAERRRAMVRRESSKALAAPMAAASEAKQDKAAESESVTNVQHAGVDEGGIVKVHGDFLVVLRRGRLFTVRIGNNQLQPVAALDAYGPGIDPGGAWYDEMLIEGDTVVVIGYSYQRGGSEIGLFKILSDGQLAHQSTHHLRSNDYYSSRNYASRLIGSKLIMYSPLYLNPLADDPFAQFPAGRRWQNGATAADFRRIAPATRIYRTTEDLEVDSGLALHSVTVCELAKPQMDCQSTAVLGGYGRVFYVSPGAVYVWATQWRPYDQQGGGRQESSVFRIPFDGAAPTALKVAGAPIDQLSFLEDTSKANRGQLNVLVQAAGAGDGMWAAEYGANDLSLLRVPLDAFSDGKDAAPSSAYQRLPTPKGYAVQSRYVGQYLVYGAGNGWYVPTKQSESEVYAVRHAEPSGVYAVPLAHSVDRIEALGENAVVVGSNGNDLHFTSLRLAARFPMAGGSFARANAAQGETRSHGFFYRAESAQQGLLGLPIIGGQQSARQQLWESSASILYLRNRGLEFTQLGELQARPGSNRADGCRASCVDWYGNARPLFLRNRVFALLGYEMVEGKLENGRISESRRVSFAPDAPAYSRND